MSSTYLYSVNKVLNIDNSVNTPNLQKVDEQLNQPSKCIVIGTNNLEVENNYNDKEGIDSQVRILGGTWTDELIVQNIFCHPSGGTDGGGDIRPEEDTYTYKPQTHSSELTDTNSDVHIIKNEINIGRMGNTINVDGKNIKIGTAGNQNTDNAAVNTGNHNTADHVKFAYNDSLVDIFGEEIKIGEKDTTTTMYGKHTVIGLSETDLAQGNTVNTTLTDVTTTTIRNHIQSGNGAYSGSTFDVYAEYVKIGEKNTKMNLYSQNLNIGISKNDEEGHEHEIAVVDTTVDMFGSNINIGQEDTTFKLYGKDIKIGVTNDDNRDFTTTYDNDINGALKVEMKLYAGELKTGGMDSTTKMYTKNTFIGLNDRHSIDHHGANTTTGTDEGKAYVDSTLDVYGETINIGQKNTDMTLFAENIIVGATHKSDNTDVHNENADRQSSTFDLYSKDIKIGYQDTKTILHSEEIRFNDNSDGTRFLIKDGVDNPEYHTGNNSTIDENLATYGALIEIGNGVKFEPHDTTAHIKLDASKITINAKDELNLATAAFSLGDPTDPAYFLLDNNNSKIQIGSDILRDVRMHGSNIHIGESNGTVKIFGNVEMYSEGSNIVTNTNIETTSAFEINNTGTKTALTVVQTNEVSTEGFNLCEFFCADNQDRTPFRIDAFGRVGMGVKKYKSDGTTKKDLKAWLHVYKNSPEDLAKDSGALAGNLTADDIDIFLVEDKRFQPITKTFVLELLDTTTLTQYNFNITDRTNVEISDQADITIYVGDSIQISNNTGGHPFKLIHPTDGDLITVDNTESQTHTFDTIGTYTYVCTIHYGMNGVIKVETLPDYADTNRNGDDEYDGTPFVIKNQGDVGIGTYKPRYKLDVWSTNSQLNGQPNANGDIGSKGIALRDVVFIKQNNTNRVFYGFTRKIKHGVDQNDADGVAAQNREYYETGMEFEFKNYNGEAGGDYAYASNPLDNDSESGLTVANNTELQNNVITTTNNYPFDGSNNTFGFRMSIKLHISGDNGQIAYRRFEAFISPQNNSSSVPQTPGLITIADLFDSEYEYYRFLDIKINRLDDKKFKLIVEWKTQITTLMGTNGVKVPLSSRVYVDIEYFGHEYLGDIQAEIINKTITTTTTHPNAILW